MSIATAPETASLESMTFDELLSLRERLDAFIADRLSREEKDLESRLARIKRLKHSPSIVAQSETHKKADGRRGKLPPRYRNPDDPSQTWAGRGLQPRWLKHALKSGKKLSHFRLANGR